MPTAIRSVSWSKSGSLLAASNSIGEISVLELKNRTSINKAALKHKGSLGVKVKFSEWDEHWLYSVSEASSFCVWDLEKPPIGALRYEPILEFKNHTADITDIAISPSNDKLIATVGKDNKLCLFDVKDKQSLIKPFTFGYDLTCVVFNSEGDSLYIGTNTGEIVVLDLSNPKNQTVLTSHRDQRGGGVTSISFAQPRKGIVGCIGLTQDFSRPSEPTTTWKPVIKSPAIPSQVHGPSGSTRGDKSVMGDMLDTSSRHSAMSDISRKAPSVIESVPIPPAAPVIPIIVGEALKKKPTSAVFKEDYEKPQDAQMKVNREREQPVHKSAPLEPKQGSQEMHEVIEKLLDHKLDVAKKEIILMVREEQRNLHVEMIRQFEIQKEFLSGLLDQKTQENNLQLLEIQRLQEELALLRRNQFN